MTWRLFPALDDDWRLVVGGAAARAARARWADDAVLASYPDVGSVVEALRSGGNDRDAADRVLGALAARAPVDDVALRAMLQALLPGLVNVAKRLGRGTVDEDLEATVVAEAVLRIRRYPLQRRPRAIAANVVLDVFGGIARQRARAAHREGRRALAAPASAPDPSLEVWGLVHDAYADGRLRRGDAELLLSIALGTDSLRRRAEREGTTYGAMSERWRRARDRLRRAATVAGRETHR
jgi:hypothetical protein